MVKPLPATDALEAFAEALEAMGIEPSVVEVSLPLADWQHLARTLDDEGTNTTGDIGRIEVGGVPYLIRYATRRGDLSI